MQSTSRRRRWNNFLILGVVAFMVILNLPTVIKSYLMDPPPETQYPYLLNPDLDLKAIYATQWSLTYQDGAWTLSVPAKVNAEELALRWQGIVGTEVPEDNYQALQANLPSPSSLEVWYTDQEEPQRITVYQLPQFWLLKNWQDKWIAVTLEENYLFPNDANQNKKTAP